MQVDPENRLVADSLEADWNERLRALASAKQEYERQRQADEHMLSDQQRAQILALATDFPKLWRDPKTPDRERKRMLRLLVDDVTVLKDKQITAHVRFKGGASKTLTLPLPVNEFEQHRASTEVVAEIDRLLDHHGYREIASILNERGFRTGMGMPFNVLAVGRICRTRRLKSRYNRLRERGLLTLDEISKKLGVYEGTVRIWQQHGILRAYPVTDRNQCLYEDLGPNPPKKNRGIKLAARQKVTDVMSPEVQYEA